ncbi:hypothetical protein [Alienimonas chondri]|uniref:Uracil-DNA glycosylase n=1 Tax=Alienimonas chondri TaxID=2681879 RepID=A0ABX1VFY2_9PLAN|nr:hypothetical protein [Alienimonas chondri]NNJ27010.1 hypothetical protein [Alienimonas chondri]
MPLPDDTFFDEWKAELSPEEQEAFVLDGAIDEEAWGKAPLKALFVTAEPDFETDESVKEAGDMRKLLSDDGPPGVFGMGLGRWAAILLEGAVPKKFGRVSARHMTANTAIINLKKTGGGPELADSPARGVVNWALAHQERLLDQIEMLAPEVIILCGDRVLAAWPVMLYGDASERPIMRGEYAWGDPDVLPSVKAILATVSPAAPGMKTELKNAEIDQFAASEEVRNLHDSPPALPEPETPEGDAAPAEGDATPAEGDATPADGDAEPSAADAPETEPKTEAAGGEEE